MENFHWLDQIQPFDRMLVGDEAFYLSRVMQRGYPVVPGFVVPASVCQEFLETVHWSEPLLADLPHSSLYLDVDNPRQMQRIAQQIRQDITATTFPPLWMAQFKSAQERYPAPVWILRPSLAISKKGKGATEQKPKRVEEQRGRGVGTSLAVMAAASELFDSYMVRASPEALAMGLKQTWAELFRARSLFHWQTAGIQLQQLNLAILVQPVWEAIASGSVYVTPDIWEIQATWGLYEALHKGEVIADSYLVQPETGEVKTHQLGSKTRAYRLADSAFVINQSLSQLNQSCLEAYVLSEEQQKQFALENQDLAAVIQLTQQLTDELVPAFALEWALSTQGEGEPQLSITHVRTFVVQEQQAGLPVQEPVVSDPEETTIPQPSLLGSYTDTTEKKVTAEPLIQGLAASSGRVLAQAQVVTDDSLNWSALATGKILVTKSIRPDWLPVIKQAAGLVTEQGGLTSHAAIIARELGIPAVVGVAGVTQLIQPGESLLVDGDEGQIYRHARHEPQDMEDGEATTTPTLNSQFSVLKFPHPIATQLLVNLSQTSLIPQASALPVDGVGLLRSELMLMEGLNGQHPYEWLEQGRHDELVELLAQRVSQFASAFAPRPVFYRSLDLRSHEFQFRGEGSFSPTEVNPMLGLRGTFSYVTNPELFDVELAALVQLYRSGYTNLHLMLPFVRTVEEFSFCRQRVEQAGLLQHSPFQLWIMAEVPSILFLLPEYVQAGVQGISIGTNDLTQLLLGVDRDQVQMAAAFDACHPAVVRAIAQLIQLAREAGIPCSICGQAPVQHPELIDQLITWGITSISVELDAVERTYTAIARAEQRLLLQAARRQLGTRD